MTVACNYFEALVSLDRGFPKAIELKPSAVDIVGAASLEAKPDGSLAAFVNK